MPGYRVNHQCDAANKEQPMGRYMGFDDIINIQTEKVIPMDGEMTFDGNVTDILDSLRVLLGKSIVRMHVSWSLAE